MKKFILCLIIVAIGIKNMIFIFWLFIYLLLFFYFWLQSCFRYLCSNFLKYPHILTPGICDLDLKLLYSFFFLFVKLLKTVTRLPNPFLRVGVY